MSLVTVQDLHLSYGPKVLFDETSFTIGPTDRIGLVGANGTGKSTLMKLLAGVLTPDSGRIQITRRARVGYLPQELSGLPAGTVLDAVMSAVPGRDELEARLAECERALAVSTDSDEQLELSQQLADVHAELDDFEAHYGRHHAERILVGLGFDEKTIQKPTTALSGGWRMRAALAGLLLQDPELLLLDEPTNHLDIPTLTWFDGFLKRSKKALVLISHDRDFLNRQVNRIIALEVEGLKSYAGNYDRYKLQRAQDAERLRAQAVKVQSRREELESFIDRFGAKASKARQAQSKAKALEKMETVELQEERETIRFRFPDAPRSGRDVAELRKVSRRYGELIVYDEVDARVERGQRIAVVGANGAGKTTLLKLFARELAPDSGEVVYGHNVALGYYAQHHAEKLDKSATILDEVTSIVPDKPQSHVRAILGAFLFSGDEVEKKIGVLSGGERARVTLAKLLLVPSNLLIMDEPTNHLDLDSSEMLIDALKSYGGTLLFVSHNRSFVNQLATHVWDVKNGKLEILPGNLDDYLYHQERLAAATAASTSGGDDATRGASAATLEKDRRRLEAEARQKRSAVEGPIKKEIARLEAQIASLEIEEKGLERQLADPEFYSDFARAKPVMDAHRDAKSRLEQLYASWEAAQEKLSSLAG